MPDLTRFYEFGLQWYFKPRNPGNVASDGSLSPLPPNQPGEGGEGPFSAAFGDSFDTVNN